MKFRCTSAKAKKKTGRRHLLWLVLVAVANVTSGWADTPIVIVLSWDGMRHDYARRVDLPGLERMAQDGVKAQRLIGVWPTNTFPGHVSMATGTHPDRHGIVDNRFYDRKQGTYSYSADANWIEAEPLWITAERQGLRAATYFWVGSESDWRGQRARYRVAPFDGGRPEATKVNQILAWLGMPDALRPDLIMSYWAGADSIAHRFGPDSGLLASQLVGQDYELSRLLRGIDQLDLWSRTTLMVVSDHGMTATDSALDLAGVLRQAGIEVRVHGSAVAHVFVEQADQQEKAEGVLREFLAARCPAASLYPGTALPGYMRLKHRTRTGDWVVVAQPPCVFGSTAGFGSFAAGVLNSVGWSFGDHGYDPLLMDMGGVFYAMGRGVTADLTLGEVRQIDLAATVSRLLGIEPPLNSEGLPMW